MQSMTLEELKAENARLETESETEPQPGNDEVIVEADPPEEEDFPENAENSEEESASSELEDWMQPDDQASEADKKFSSRDIAAAKTKMRAKLERKHESEVEQLRSEIQELKQNRPESRSHSNLAKPSLADFEDHDNPELAYSEALIDWKLEKQHAESSAKAVQMETQQRQQQHQQAVDQAVDQHYERAALLSQESGISADVYKSADLAVRTAIDAVLPQSGDAVADALISSLGEGSEKVFYSLGINQTKRNKLQSLLEVDPSGLKASIYLGELKASLAAPHNRKTNAPKPAPHINGDKVGQVDPYKYLRKKYVDANKKGDQQAAFDARMEARRQGANVTDW